MNRDIIYKELVQLDLEAESTDEVFSILAEKLEKAGYIRSGFLEAIKEREKIILRHCRLNLIRWQFRIQILNVL